MKLNNNECMFGNCLANIKYILILKSIFYFLLMATVKFRIRNKTSKNVNIKIYLSLGRGVFIETNSGFSISPKDWSDNTKMPKQNTAENKQIFNKLKKLETYIYDRINDVNSEGGIFLDKNWLDQQINECFSRVSKIDKGLLLNHIQWIINNASTRKIKGSNRIGLSERRIKGYVTFKGVIESYEKERKRKIHLTDIDKIFIGEFTNWLLNDKGYTKNYSGKQLSNLKTVGLDAQKIGIKVNPYIPHVEPFKEDNEDRYIVTLNEEEIEKIKNADIKREALLNVRKWLLLGCHIGQRGGDLLELTKENIRKKDDNVYMDILQRKTKKQVTVPVIDSYVKEIVLNDFPKKVSIQKLNNHLKELCKEAGIEEMIEGKKMNRKTKRKEKGVFPKFELISSHTFRRSFATNFYKRIPTPILMGITGHSRESVFLAYINRSEDKDLNADMFRDAYNNLREKENS